MRKLPGIILVAALAACHGHSVPEETRPVTPEAPATGPSGIETIDVGLIQRHVENLSADAFEGRETNQPGARKAAEYVAARYAEAGLVPLPGHQSYLVPYQLEEQGFDADKTVGRLEIAGDELPLAAGGDFTPFYFSEAGTASGAIVFAGYGISAPDQGYDDYAGLDVKGKLVLVLRHAPNEKRESNPIARRHSTFTSKAMVAYQKGAIGMLLVTDPLHHRGGDDLRMNGRLSLPTPVVNAKAGAKAAPARRSRGMPPRPAGVKGPFISLHISKETADKIIAPTGRALVDIQKQLDAGGKASAVSLVGTTASFTVHKRAAPRPVTAHNVIGFLPGSDPAFKDQWVVIGGHYDHLGAFSGEGDTVYNGADDNASGTTGVMVLAKAFASLPSQQRPKRSLLFMAFSGEEKGLLGSRAAVAQDIIPTDKVVFMLNLDMIGRNPEKPLLVAGDGYATGLSELMADEAGRMSFNIQLGGNDYQANSDHHSFFSESIPVLFFFTGLHESYHQLGDHADKIDFDNMGKVIRLGYRLIEQIGSSESSPRFIHHITWLGIAIQVKGDGAAARAEITAVEPQSRAAKLGFAVGDVLTAVGGKLLGDPNAADATGAARALNRVGERFAKLKPGSKSPVHLQRAGASIELQVERARRGYLGVMPRPIDEELRKKLGLGEGEGIKIANLTGDGPAGKSGIKKDDILIRIAGHPVGPRTLGRYLSRIGAGEKVDIVVIRGGKRVKLELVLGARPERPQP